MINILYFIGLEVMSLLADYFIKRASLQTGFIGWKYLFMGGFVYFLSAFGWFFLMRSFKLVTIGVFHSFAVIGLSMMLGLVVFNEKITLREIIGIILGCASILLLVRFQD